MEKFVAVCGKEWKGLEIGEVGHEGNEEKLKGKEKQWRTVNNGEMLLEFMKVGYQHEMTENGENDESGRVPRGWWMCSTVFQTCRHCWAKDEGKIWNSASGRS